MLKSKEIQFPQIVLKNKDKIFRICYAYLYDKEEVEDLYQEILINIWQNLGSFRGASLLINSQQFLRKILESSTNKNG